jgi:hypothetical protein
MDSFLHNWISLLFWCMHASFFSFKWVRERKQNKNSEKKNKRGSVIYDLEKQQQ